MTDLIELAGVTDWHTHVSIPEQHTAQWARKERTRMTRLSPLPSEHRKALNGVSNYVIVGTQWGDAIGHDIPNEFVAEQVEASGGRGKGFGSVHPGSPTALREIERIRNDYGLDGLKLSPSYQGFNPLEPEAVACFAKAAEVGLAVMVHCGGAYASRAALEYSRPALLDPIARLYPELPIIIAHMGQPYVEETIMLMRKHESVYSDLSARSHRPWQLYSALVNAYQYGVTDKILFGSDYPVRTPTEAIRELFEISQLSEERAMYPIPVEVISEIIYERPFSLLF